MAVVITGKLSSFCPGDTLQVRYTISLNESPADLTDDTVWFCIKDRYDGEELLHVEADVLTDGANGVALLTVTAAQTALLNYGTHVYEVHWSRDNFERTLIVDTVRVVRRVHSY